MGLLGYESWESSFSVDGEQMSATVGNNVIVPHCRGHLFPIVAMLHTVSPDTTSISPQTTKKPSS